MVVYNERDDRREMIQNAFNKGDRQRKIDGYSLQKVKGVSFYRNCGAAPVGGRNECLVYQLC